MGLFKTRQVGGTNSRRGPTRDGREGGCDMADNRQSMLDEFDDGLDISSLIGDDADDIVMTDGDEWSGEDDVKSQAGTVPTADIGDGDTFDDATQCIDDDAADRSFDYFDDAYDGDVDTADETDDGRNDGDVSGISADQLRDIVSAVIDEKLSGVIGQLVDETKETTSEVKAVRRLYHNNYAKQLSSMQAELDDYHKIDKGRVYEPILRDIAHVVVNSYFVVDSIADEKVRRSFAYVIDELIQTLDDYGAHMQRSEPGEKRNPHYCQIIHKIPTNDPSLHDTIKESHAIGFYVENRPLIREQVDVYAYVKPQPTDNQDANN